MRSGGSALTVGVAPNTVSSPLLVSARRSIQRSTAVTPATARKSLIAAPRQVVGERQCRMPCGRRSRRRGPRGGRAWTSSRPMLMCTSGVGARGAGRSMAARPAASAASRARKGETPGDGRRSWLTGRSRAARRRARRPSAAAASGGTAARARAVGLARHPARRPFGRLRRRCARPAAIGDGRQRLPAGSATGGRRLLSASCPPCVDRRGTRVGTVRPRAAHPAPCGRRRGAWRLGDRLRDRLRPFPPTAPAGDAGGGVARGQQGLARPADGPARAAPAGRGCRSSAHPVEIGGAARRAHREDRALGPAISPGEFVHLVEQARAACRISAHRKLAMSRWIVCRASQAGQASAERNFRRRRASPRAAPALPRAAVPAQLDPVPSVQRASSNAAGGVEIGCRGGVRDVARVRHAEPQRPAIMRERAFRFGRLQRRRDLGRRQRELSRSPQASHVGEGGQCRAEAARVQREQGEIARASGSAAASISSSAGQPARARQRAPAARSALPRSHAASSASPDSGRADGSAPGRTGCMPRPACGAPRLSRRQRRLGRLGHREVALPALVLELDVLDRDRVGVGVEIGQRLVLRHPAAEHLVGDGQLAGLVVELDDDVLAEVRSARPPLPRPDAEVPDLVRPAARTRGRA